MESRLRLAQARDLAAVETIVEAAYAPYIDRIGRKPGPMLDDYAARILEGRVHVAEQGGAVVGLLVLIPETEDMLLDNVAVAPEASGRGVGRMLMDFAEAATRDAGYDRIRLYTHVLMTENVAIYQRRGYAETHRGAEKGFERVYMTKHVGR